MPLSREQFQALRAQGMTVDDIVARERGSQPAAAPLPPAPPQASGDPANPLAGAVGTLQGINPRAVLGVGGLGGAGYLARRFITSRGRGAPPASTSVAPPPAETVPPQIAEPAAAPVEPSIPSRLPPGTPSGTPTPGLDPQFVQVTEEDIAKLPQLRNREPGHIIRRSTLERMYENAAAPKEPIPINRGAKRSSPQALAREYRKSEPTRPITTEGKPAKAPANTPPNGPGVGRGKSGPKLAREAAYREGNKPPAGSAASRAKLSAVPEVAAPSLEEQLAQSVSAEQAMSRAALAPAERQFVRSGLRSAMGGVGGGALQLLMYLMGAGHSQEDMDAAYQMLQQLKTPEQRQMEEMLARRSQPS